MDKSDIQYIVDMINDSINNKDWDMVEEAKETLKEFLEPDEPLGDD